MEHVTLLGIRLGEQCLTKVTISCYKWLQPTMAKVVIVQDCGIGRILVTHFTMYLPESFVSDDFVYQCQYIWFFYLYKFES